MKLKSYNKADKHLYVWLNTHFADREFVRKIQPRTARLLLEQGIIINMYPIQQALLLLNHTLSSPGVRLTVHPPKLPLLHENQTRMSISVSSSDALGREAPAASDESIPALVWLLLSPDCIS